jgi:integrase/recombinase XerD
MLFNIMSSRSNNPNGNGTTGRRSRAEYHLTRAQLLKVLAAAVTTRDGAILAFMAETGVRRSEVVNLDISDLRLSERIAVVKNAKGGKTRLVPLTEALMSLLTDCIGDRTKGPVFLSRGNNRLSTRQVNRIVEKAGVTAAVQHPDPNRTRLNCHLFRHTFARLWKEAGGSIETLSSILGHASQATTMDLYGREGLSDVRSNYAKTMRRISILTNKGELK